MPLGELLLAQNLPNEESCEPREKVVVVVGVVLPDRVDERRGAARRYGILEELHLVVEPLRPVVHVAFAINEQGVVVGSLGDDLPALGACQSPERSHHRIAACVVAGGVAGDAETGSASMIRERWHCVVGLILGRGRDHNLRMMSRSNAIAVRGQKNPGSGSLVAALWRCVVFGKSDRFHWFLAERAFLAGRLDVAQWRYRRVRRDAILTGKARLMDDWIRFHNGDYSTGWPRYPGAAFVPPLVPATPPVTMQPFLVADPRQPVELVTHAGMRQWEGAESPVGPLVVWFNFKDSLGGEILASRLVQLLQKRHQGPLILAVAARLVPLVQATFPDCRVIDKAGDLAPFVNECHQFVLARDLLGLLVASDADFAALADARLLVPASATQPKRSSCRQPRIALSWKTTNDRQGVYRNVPVDQLAAVIAGHDVEWHIAQHGDVASDVATLRRLAPQASIFDDTLHPLGDMATFAGELAALDAVVTVDNTLLHLAGGLGLPTLGLLSVPAYWAWPAAGMGSRWYASVRLLRQPRAGDWRGLLSSFDRELKTFVSTPE